jgi:hypothetical protein
VADDAVMPRGDFGLRRFIASLASRGAGRAKIVGGNNQVLRGRRPHVARESDRAGVRRLYGDLFAQVSAVLFAADPIGINFGSNADEYEPEASTIIPRLRECRSAQDVQAVVHEEFLAWFGLEADDRCAELDLYVEPAEKIWDLWQRYLAAQHEG